jgi:hypothetical protein
MTDNRAGRSEVAVPFVFVPHGEPPPTEWLSRHPRAFGIPATMVLPTEEEGAPEPSAVAATLNRAGAAASPARPRGRLDPVTPPMPTETGADDPVGTFMLVKRALDDPGAAAFLSPAVGTGSGSGATELLGIPSAEARPARRASPNACPTFRLIFDSSGTADPDRIYVPGYGCNPGWPPRPERQE